MPEKTKSRKILCPECDTECSVTRDDEGDDVGKCDNCGLNVGRVITRRRYDAALERMKEQAEKEKKAGKKESAWW